MCATKPKIGVVWTWYGYHGLGSLLQSVFNLINETADTEQWSVKYTATQYEEKHSYNIIILYFVYDLKYMKKISAI